MDKTFEDGMLSNKKLPYQILISLSFAAFIAIMTETVLAGLLIDMSRHLDSSISITGQYITAYGLGSVVATIPIMTAARNVSQRTLLLAALGALFTTNLLTAINSNIIIGLSIRVIAGIAGGVSWGVLANYARSVVSKSSEGKALAIVSFGQPIALAFGVPLGSWVGEFIGWRGVFISLALTTAILSIWMYLHLPIQQKIKQSHSLNGMKVLSSAARSQGVIAVLTMLFCWICAHNVLYTFLNPFIAEGSKFISTSAILLIFGIFATLGIIITSFTVDRFTFYTGFVSGCCILFGFAFIWLWPDQLIFLTTGIIFWGLGFGGAPIVLQTAIARRAGEYADIAQSIFVTVFNLAVALGGLAGSVVIRQFGIQHLPIFAALLSALALAIAFWKPWILRVR